MSARRARSERSQSPQESHRPIAADLHAAQQAAERAGVAERDVLGAAVVPEGDHGKLNQNLGIGTFIHLDRTRKQAIRAMTSWYEEHLKMFAPAGFRAPHARAAEATERRGGRAQADVPTLERFMRGSWFGGMPADLIELSTCDLHAQAGDAQQLPCVPEMLMPAFKGKQAMAAE